ncbi:2-succinyl-5-enolpyruvyl-6-hydroxy-3-cyclohexene-1-carboxylic-acid synthase [Prosthecochloris vibrioformis]|uniref:2-succinyl-5-enolpyruvyl-6-hydroxy-3-cyclohexene-1-carboxylate synthase n=1 Tax=Prosthecochloris vibrioformis TaxID=1098 RepID=A0A5C4S3Z9_PROVB|nr:2-succinyl-5-enolpyruvyl-6-hydroxy-3-cyclohexene-1-carboxylic-acid synthase [Prosthecochloris vibrioformis]TNJ37928.1 2-succinyl-5-enolpyruvyl-6-hydroxy-3-cyclohexene-1-carboxylic-acid synthase [Prosthecochloris vibrioformis]
MKLSDSRTITTLWSDFIIEELVRSGITMFCISPGSRSTPLTTAAARHPEASCSIFPDERAAAFFALGYARATGKAAALVCTSGTAAANYYPAVVEAAMDRQPMLLLTADRPHELRETGANQTIHQEGMFGRYTRWAFQFPEPSPDYPAASLLSTIDHAIARSQDTPAGPVHLNIPFREPLDPVVVAPEAHPWTGPVTSWLAATGPFSRKIRTVQEPSPDTVATVTRILDKAHRPLLVVGRLETPEGAEAIISLARHCNAPLYADISSTLRLQNSLKPLQHLLLAPDTPGIDGCDVIVHFGGALVSRSVERALEKWTLQDYVLIKSYPDRYDPSHRVTLEIDANPAMFARAMLEQGISTPKESWLQTELLAETETELDRWFAPEDTVSEPSAARLISTLVSPDHGLFLANSMPVRDMDLYGAAVRQDRLPIAMNRGASGIDGIIATAAGFSEGLQRPVTLVIGDISFLHDLNSLALLRRRSHPLHIVVVNNNGGGIFSFLPIAASAEEELFETCFATPQEYDIPTAAATFGIPCTTPATNDELRRAYLTLRESGQSGIVQVVTARRENWVQHRELNERLQDIIRKHIC